jgi:puromycin-sensitive aminopeptidase
MFFYFVKIQRLCYACLFMKGGGLISRLVKYLTENFVTEDDAREVTDFFINNPFPGTERTIQQAIESIRLNEAWLKRDERPLREFLTKVAN